MDQVIKKIADEIANSPFNVSAIEMSPQLHLSFVHELVNMGNEMRDLQGVVSDRVFMNLPILFVHGADDYFKLLNRDQCKLRLNHSKLLGIYNEKYNRLKIFISNSYKIENSNSVQFNQTAELASLVFRLNQIERQMTIFS